jgi:hypothetical protein
MMTTIKNHNVHVSWFMYLYLNFRVEQEGQSSVPPNTRLILGFNVLSPEYVSGPYKVRHAIVNATLIENLAISAGSSHTNSKHFMSS